MPVERSPIPPDAKWVKSSRSGGNGGACVEVARNLPDVIGIRDSKDPSGPVLVIETAAWLSFTEALKTDRLR